MKPWYLNGFTVTIIVVIGSFLVDFFLLTAFPAAKTHASAILAAEAVTWGIIIAVLMGKSKQYDKDQETKKFISGIKSNYDQKK